MTEAEILLVEEGLKLADDAMARLMEVKNEHIAHIASLLHAAIVFGEMIIK
jgi:hypothetical protein